MRSIYTAIFLILLLMALILFKNQICSREQYSSPAAVSGQPEQLIMPAGAPIEEMTPKPAPTPPIPLSPAVQTALTNVTSRAQSAVERAMVGEMVANEMRYIAAKAKQGSVGPNLPSEEKFFLNIGYERRKKELTAQLLTNPPLSEAANQLVAALHEQAMELRSSSPFVGGLHPKIKQLFKQVISQL